LRILKFPNYNVICLLAEKEKGEPTTIDHETIDDMDDHANEWQRLELRPHVNVIVIRNYSFIIIFNEFIDEGNTHGDLEDPTLSDS